MKCLFPFILVSDNRADSVGMCIQSVFAIQFLYYESCFHNLDILETFLRVACETDMKCLFTLILGSDKRVDSVGMYIG